MMAALGQKLPRRSQYLTAPAQYCGISQIPLFVRVRGQGWRQANGHGAQLICQTWAFCDGTPDRRSRT